jgi:hypothetical protein
MINVINYRACKSDGGDAKAERNLWLRPSLSCKS